MTQPYINVSEYIEDASKLYYDGSYYYDTDLYGILKPLSSKYGINFFGNYQEFNANSPFSIHQLIETPEHGIEKLAIIDDVLVVLDTAYDAHFYKINSTTKGEFIDDVYINSTFSSDILSSKFRNIVVGVNGGAIFIKDNQEVIFHDMSPPTDIDALIDDRLVVSAAINMEKHFCLVFDDGTVLYHTGVDLSDGSYELIPNSIIIDQDYSSFTVNDFKSPNIITNAIQVVAYDGFAILTFDGNVIVWGGEFQRINNNETGIMKPVATFDVDRLSGCGLDYGVGIRENGEAVAWGEDVDNRLANILEVSDLKSLLPLPVGLFYTTEQGKIVSYSNDTFPDTDPVLVNYSDYYSYEDLQAFNYIQQLAYSLDGYMFAMSKHDNLNTDSVRLDFKLREYNGGYYIPLLHFMDYEPANVELEVYSVCKSEYNSIGRNLEFSVVDTYYNEHGIADFSKIVIAPIDKDRNGVPDEPLAYKLIVNRDDFIIMETFVDINNSEVTRVSNDTHVLSESAFISPNEIYYADADKTVVDNDGNHVHYTEGNFYKGEPLTDGVNPNKAMLLENAYDADTGTTYSVEHGRSFTYDDPFKFQWTHYSSDGADRIDPSVSTIMDMYVLTNTYDNAVRRWLRSGNGIESFPTPPTSEEIRNNIRFIERNKSTSDQVIYIPAEYKLLFGTTARPEHQAEFKIVKMDGATLTDNEIKSHCIDAINEYFDIDNWDFGESFYFTELAAHIHNKLSGHVASVVVVPKFQSSSFGDLFQIKCEPNELFLSTATVNEIIITNQYTNQNLRKFR